MRLRHYIWTILYSIFLVSFTVYIVSDTFIISRTYTVVASSGSLSAAPEASSVSGSVSDNSGSEGVISESSTYASEAAVTDTSFVDENISITITEYRENDTTIYVADVYVSAPEYLKTAFAESAYGRNVTEKTSEIAEDSGAILAINGDFYGSQSKGYVIRNGSLYRSSVSDSTREDLAIWSDGDFSIVTEGEISAEELMDSGAQQVLSFGPALVIDGTVSVTPDEEVGKAMASNPRTAIGIVDVCNYLFVVADGRTDESAGLSLYELADFMQSLGADTAYNLDGGGSSTMVFNGKVINNPTGSGSSIKERSVSDIVYIG